MTVSSAVDAGQDQVWRVLDDIALLASCLPGAELTEDLGGGAYAGRARVSVGPIKLTFHGTARIVEYDRRARRLRMLARGQDAGGAQTHAAIVLRTDPTESGTALHAEADVYLTGRIAQFGRALAGDVSRRMFEQFADALALAATSGEMPTGGGTTPPSATRLFVSALRSRFHSAVARLRAYRSRGQQ